MACSWNEQEENISWHIYLEIKVESGEPGRQPWCFLGPDHGGSIIQPQKVAAASSIFQPVDNSDVQVALIIFYSYHDPVSCTLFTRHGLFDYLVTSKWSIWASSLSLRNAQVPLRVNCHNILVYLGRNPYFNWNSILVVVDVRSASTYWPANGKPLISPGHCPEPSLHMVFSIQ